MVRSLSATTVPFQMAFMLAPPKRGRSSFRVKRAASPFSAKTMLRPRELPLAHLLAIARDRLPHVAAQLGVALGEARAEVVEEAQQVRRHQDLPVAVRPRADADGRHLDRLRDARGQL